MAWKPTHKDRLDGMIEDVRGDTWDLSPNDREMLTAARAEIERLQEVVLKCDGEADKMTDKLSLMEAEHAAEIARLQAFKDWVHRYFDSHGVPHHPPGTHSVEGCRIGDRMDWLMADRERLTAREAALVACVEYASAYMEEHYSMDNWSELKRAAGIE